MPDTVDSVPNIDKYSYAERHAILVSAVAHVNAVTPDAKIAIIHSDALPQYIDAHRNDIHRYRLIVHDNVHYTTVDVNPASKTCLVLDAAVDDRGYLVRNNLSDQGYKALFADYLTSNIEEIGARRLQNDNYSCSMFALDHCIQLTHSADTIYDDIQKKMADFPVGSDEQICAGMDIFPWDVLPPNFL